MRQADLVTPVAAANRNQVQLGGDDASTNRRCKLLGALVAEADVPVAVADSDVADEAGVLPGARLLLHGHDLHHIVLELLRREEDVNDLVLLDGKRVQIDVLNRGDLAVLHQSTKLRARSPLLLLTLSLTLLSSLLATLSLTESALEVALALALTLAFSTHVVLNTGDK